MVNFLITAVLYLMISGLFFQSQLKILLFGVGLIGIAIALFEVFPDLIFLQELDLTELHTAVRFTLLFGLLSSTVLVFISNKIASTVLGHTRNYAE
jgi:hypothetical protein